MSDKWARHLLSRAKAGDTQAVQQLVMTYREYLRDEASRLLGPRIKKRVDASDIVQQTILEAYRDFPAFNGNRQSEWFAWLKQIFQNNIAQTIRDNYSLKKRAVHREMSLSDSNVKSFSRRDCLRAEQSTPSQKAMRKENAENLREALTRIPELQQKALMMRYFDRQSLREIAEEMGRSESAVAGFLKRGLINLRQFHADPK